MKFQLLFFSFISILACTFSANVNDLPVRDRCRIFEFRCANAKCIAQPLKCNGKDDCGDNSDEVCDNLDKFQCDDETFIPKSSLCDGHNDCSNDENQSICEKHKCSKDHFLCRKLPMSCIDINSVCNNVKDCADDSDESQDACEYLRTSKLVECNNDTQFQCANKQLCVSKIYRCDGNEDCTDKSDEMNCPSSDKKIPDKVPIEKEMVSTAMKCTPEEFYCGAESPIQCISKDWVCDSSFDCEVTNRDEENCPNFKCPFNKPNKCARYDICYENEKHCDGLQDCPDSSDEFNCTKPPHKVECNPRTEFKCFKKNECIPWSKVCDRIDDCGDNSDERPGGSVDNCKNKPCEKDNGGCDQECVSMFYDRKCFCKPGYQIGGPNLTKCLDIDECATGFTCSHICKNTKGSFECQCFPGFYKSTTNASQCEAVGEKFLLFSSKNSIRELRLVHQHLEELVGVTNGNLKLQAIDIDFSYKFAKIFWTQYEPYAAIVQMQYKSTSDKIYKKIDLVTTRIHSPNGLAYDWIHGLLFWTDAFYREISVLNVTNGHRRVLLRLNNDSKLQSIVVHPKFRRIYWTDWGNKPRIMSMGLDGQDIKTIVDNGLITPNGLAIDYYLNELYWVDARARSIKSYHLKSGLQREVASYLNVYGFSLDVFEDWLYLSDWHHQRIIKVHKITGTMEMLIPTPKPLGLKLMHQLAQPEDIENVCTNNPCQYFCLPSALNVINDRQFRCQCPDYSDLLPDERYCSPVLDRLLIDSRTSKTNNSNSKRNLYSKSEEMQKQTIYLIVGFVFAFVALVLIFFIVVGILMYRNYFRLVIKRATKFNNPIYYRKTSTHDLQILNPESHGVYDVASNGLITNVDDGQKMVSDK